VYDNDLGDPDESGFHIFLKDDEDNSAELHVVCWTEDIDDFMDGQGYRFWTGMIGTVVRRLSDFGHPNRFGSNDENGFVNLVEVAIRLETGDNVRTMYECDYIDFY
jgi:hypothetical protein